MTDDPIMERITAAVSRSQAGDALGAREAFAAIWHEIGPQADPFHRCTLAHYAADVQDDLQAELAWDLEALAAAREVSDARAKEHHPSLSIAGFFPSLHLNLASVYQRLGDVPRAREHVAAARAAFPALADDGYGSLIRSGVDRVEAALPA